MQKRSENKISKLATIKGLLNGTLSIKDFLPQQIYFVNIRGGIYEVDGKEMSKDEYEKWKAANVRMSIDVLFIMNFNEDDSNRDEQGNNNKIEHDTWKAINTFDTNEEKEEKMEKPKLECVNNYLEYRVNRKEEQTITESTNNSTRPEPLFTFPVLPKRTIKEARKPDVKKIEAKEIVEPEPVKRTFGKLSEYGIIWECQRN